MEGFVELKTLFTNPTVYMVLDRQQLTCFDRLEGRPLRTPVSVRFTVSVRDAKIVKSSSSFEHGLKVIIANKTFTKFGCGDANVCSNWFKALTRAARLLDEERAYEEELITSRRLLEIDSHERLTKRRISVSYKQKCLVNHPDRGGDAEKFNELYKAYERLAAIQAEDEQRERCKTVEYEAIVEKGPGSVGLGIMVTENRIRQAVIISSVQETILLHGLSIEAEGEIRPDDRLMSIEHDDCSAWPISRIRARLGHARVPVGIRVHLTFERRLEIEEPVEVNREPPDSPVNAPTSNASFTHAPPPPPLRSLLGADSMRIDRTDETRKMKTEETVASLTESTAAAALAASSASSRPDDDALAANASDDSPAASTGRRFSSPLRSSVTRRDERATEESRQKPRDKSPMRSMLHALSSSLPTSIMTATSRSAREPTHPPAISQQSTGPQQQQSLESTQTQQLPGTELKAQEQLLTAAAHVVSELSGTTTDSIPKVTKFEEDGKTDIPRPNVADTATSPILAELQSEILTLEQQLYSQAKHVDDSREDIVQLQERLQQLQQLLEVRDIDSDDGLGRRFIEASERLAVERRIIRLLSASIATKRYMQERYCGAATNRLPSTDSSRHHQAMEWITSRNKAREARAIALESRLSNLLTSLRSPR